MKPPIRISWPGVAVFGLALAGGISLAIWGGEYSGHAEGLLGLAVGVAARFGAVGR